MSKKEQMNKKTKFISRDVYIPDSILEDIFSRLPVKSLLRFRSVSKTWKRLIKHPSVVNMHLNRSQQNKHSIKLMFESEELGNELPISKVLDQFDISIELNFCDNGIFSIYRSCNGILLLCKGASIIEESEEELVLWNPSTKERKRLPEAPSEDIDAAYDIHYGFGYSEASSDYKVVRIRSVFVRKEWAAPQEVSVYSLNTNSWRILDGGCYDDIAIGSPLPSGPGAGVFVGGYLHWVAASTPDYGEEMDDEEEMDKEDTCIFAFDIEKELFAKVPSLWSYKDVKVISVNGKLCTLICTMCGCEVWLQGASDRVCSFKRQTILPL